MADDGVGSVPLSTCVARAHRAARSVVRDIWMPDYRRSASANSSACRFSRASVVALGACQPRSLRARGAGLRRPRSRSAVSVNLRASALFSRQPLADTSHCRAPRCRAQGCGSPAACAADAAQRPCGCCRWPRAARRWEQRGVVLVVRMSRSRQNNRGNCARRFAFAARAAFGRGLPSEPLVLQMLARRQRTPPRAARAADTARCWRDAGRVAMPPDGRFRNVPSAPVAR